MAQEAQKWGSRTLMEPEDRMVGFLPSSVREMGGDRPGAREGSECRDKGRTFQKERNRKP